MYTNEIFTSERLREDESTVIPEITFAGGDHRLEGAPDIRFGVSLSDFCWELQELREIESLWPVVAIEYYISRNWCLLDGVRV